MYVYACMLSAEISDDLFLLVIDHKFRIPPYFFLSPLFRATCFFSPTLTNSPPPCFTQIHLLFTCFTCISFPPTFTMMHLCITQCTYWTPLCTAALPHFKTNTY